MKEATLARNRSKTKVFVDFEPIKTISLAAALVLSSEIDRWTRSHGRPLYPVRVRNWSPQVKGLLDDLGFFELLGISPGRGYRKTYDENEVTVLPLTSCTTSDGRKIAEILERLSLAAEVFEHDPLLYAAMVEAAYNSCLHAYPDDHEYKFPPIRQRWWATASWSPKRQEFRFLVYDQGVGIAQTLPRWSRYENMLAWLSNLSEFIQPFVKEHSRMIEAALEVARTSRSAGHGQGLADMVAPVVESDAGRLRILSGKGSIQYTASGAIKREEHSLHLGGTLIEWTLPVRHPQLGTLES